MQRFLFARYELNYPDANSFEFDETSQHTVIDFMEDQNNDIQKGGTMRLGAYPCALKPCTKLYDLYKKDFIEERHRHRYEFNNRYREEFENHGMIIAGFSPDKKLVEALEGKDHPFYICVQYHPEFKSRPNRPHPIFHGFIAAGLKHHNP